LSGPDLRPNARRDGFEETPAYERFLENAAMLGRHLSKQCREQSKLRISQSSLERKLALAETVIDLDFFVDESHKDTTVRDFQRQLTELAYSKTRIRTPAFASRLKSLNRRLERLQGDTPLLEARLDGRKLQRIDTHELCDESARPLLKAAQPGNITTE